MLTTLLDILHVFVCAILMFVVLLQQSKGGGMGAAFGGGASTQVFGGRGAGNLLTRATAVCAAIFMMTSVGLAYLSSSGDRALRERAAQEDRHHAEQAAARPKDQKSEPPSPKKPAGDQGASPKAPTPPAEGAGTPQK